jgi:hypothetical protein
MFILRSEFDKGFARSFKDWSTSGPLAMSIS